MWLLNISWHLQIRNYKFLKIRQRKLDILKISIICIIETMRKKSSHTHHLFCDIESVYKVSTKSERCRSDRCSIYKKNVFLPSRIILFRFFSIHVYFFCLPLLGLISVSDLFWASYPFRLIIEATRIIFFLHHFNIWISENFRDLFCLKVNRKLLNPRSKNFHHRFKTQNIKRNLSKVWKVICSGTITEAGKI